IVNLWQAFAGHPCIPVAKPAPVPSPSPSFSSRPIWDIGDIKASPAPGSDSAGTISDIKATLPDGVVNRGTISGHIFEYRSSGDLPYGDVTITVKNNELGTIQSTKTSSDGSFAF